LSRYETILDLINVFKPQSIVETGTLNGGNAHRMITQAQKHNKDISYTGYDLFEDATPETDAQEFNVKPHNQMAVVEAALKRTQAKIHLIKGNTRETLKNYTADFAFIDGGHSLETIDHDYQALKHSRVIIFDDYYSPDHEGKMPDIQRVGCNLLVERLPHAVIPTQDRVEGGGFVNLAIVFGVP
jgi:predicted O-methyltransferase YrrM